MSELSLGDMISTLTKIALVMPEAEHAALDHASALVLEEVKAEIGHYQRAAGPFEKWKELADATKDDRERHGFPRNEPLLRTGELRDSYERTVGVHEAWVGSNNMIAVYQELGTRTIPARSVLGIAAMHCEKEIHEITGRYFYGALVSGGAVQAALGKVAGSTVAATATASTKAATSVNGLRAGRQFTYAELHGARRGIN